MLEVALHVRLNIHSTRLTETEEVRDKITCVKRSSCCMKFAVLCYFRALSVSEETWAVENLAVKVWWKILP